MARPTRARVGARRKSLRGRAEYEPARCADKEISFRDGVDYSDRKIQPAVDTISILKWVITGTAQGQNPETHHDLGIEQAYSESCVSSTFSGIFAADGHL
ncbi:MAG: hypothetical protein ACI9YM_002494 [Brevundimonas sp.]|jgi:hypothetical protein